MARAKRVDDNQGLIVEKLLKIPGVQVEVGHDDILVGYNGQTYWFEIKNPSRIFDKSMGVKAGSFKDSQVQLIKNWTGHYRIVWDIDQILSDIGAK